MYTENSIGPLSFVYKYAMAFILILAFSNFYIGSYINSKTMNIFIVVAIYILLFRKINKKLTIIAFFIIMFHALIVTVNWSLGSTVNWVAWFSEFTLLLGGLLILLCGYQIIRYIGFINAFNCFTLSLLLMLTIMMVKLITSLFNGVIHETLNISPFVDMVYYFSQAASLVYLPLYFLLKKKLSRLYNNLSIITIMLFVFIIFSTGWRAIQLGFLISLTLLLLHSFVKSKNIKNSFNAIMVSTILATTIVFISNSFTSDESYKSFGLSDTLTNINIGRDISGGRLSLLGTSLNIYNDLDIMKKFFGIGGGQYPSYFGKQSSTLVELSFFDIDISSEKKIKSITSSSRLHSHNLLMHLLIDYGLVGLILYFFALYKILKSIPKVGKRYYFNIMFFSIIVTSQLTAIGYLTSPMLWIAIMFAISSRYLVEHSMEPKNKYTRPNSTNE